MGGGGVTAAKWEGMRTTGGGRRRGEWGEGWGEEKGGGKAVGTRRLKI